MNHFEDFVNTLKVQSWMSEEFRRLLNSKVAMAMQDAYQRGQANALQCHTCDPNDPLTKAKAKADAKRARGLAGLNKADRAAVRKLAAKDMIEAIKKVRDIVDVTLLDAKNYCERVRGRIPVGINTVTGKNRYRDNK